MQTLAN